MEQNEELIKTWIGTKNQDECYKKMQRGGFSILAFLFSDILFIIKKMYAEAIILVVLQMLLATVLSILKAPIVAYILVLLTFCIILGFTYYYLYKWNIERKIKKYQKKNLSYEQQLEVARNNSGDKITLGVILMFIVTGIISIIMAVGMYEVIKIVNKENYLDTKENPVNNSDDHLYDDSNSNNYDDHDEYNDYDDYYTNEYDDYNVNSNENMLIGKWYDNNNGITLLLNSDGTMEFYTDDMTTIHIKGTYSLEQQEEEYGDEYLLTISTTDRTLQGTHLTDSYTTQYSLVTDDYTEMVMLNVITYSMYDFVKIG